MKKRISLLLCAAFAAALLAGCGGSASEAGQVGDGTSQDSMTVEPADSTPADGSSGDTEAADTAKLEAIVAAIEAVNPVPTARPYDDFSVENELMLTMDNIVDFRGDVTNDNAESALVFAAQVKDGTADAVKAELEAKKAEYSSNLYLEFADKVAKAQDARIVSEGNFVVFVIAGVNGPDYADIDAAIASALAQ